MLLYGFARAVLTPLFHLFFSLKFEGKENIPKEGGFIVCSNHRTNLDPIFLGMGIRRCLKFMAKSELFKNPVFGAMLKGLGAFPVKRGAGDSEALDKAIQTVKDGNVLAMFPEGTRSKDGVPLKPKSGVAFLAAKSGADVIPAAIIFGGKLGFRSKVTVRYGRLIKNDEIAIDDMKSADIRASSKYIMDRIVNLLNNNETK